MSFALWVDAGSDVGGGHVARAEALDAALRARGARTGLFARDPKAVYEASHGRLSAERADDARIATRLRECGFTTLVYDLPHTRPADPGALAKAGAAGITRIGFDPAAEAFAHLDGVIDAVARADEVPTALRLRLLGPPHAVVGAEALRTRRLRAGARDRPRLLIAFGASDPYGQTARALEALARLPACAAIPTDVLVGPLVAPAARRSIERAAARLEAVRLHVAPAEPLAIAGRADLALCGFGTFLLAALANGLPCVLWHASAAHAAVARRFLGRFEAPPALDCAAQAGEAAPAQARAPEALSRALGGLAEDPAQRTALSRAALAAIDGRGADRVASALLGRGAPKEGS